MVSKRTGCGIIPADQPDFLANCTDFYSRCVQFATTRARRLFFHAQHSGRAALIAKVAR
jgi:hypothetical protein